MLLCEYMGLKLCRIPLVSGYIWPILLFPSMYMEYLRMNLFFSRKVRENDREIGFTIFLM